MYYTLTNQISTLALTFNKPTVNWLYCYHGPGYTVYVLYNKCMLITFYRHCCYFGVCTLHLYKIDTIKTLSTFRRKFVIYNSSPHEREEMVRLWVSTIPVTVKGADATSVVCQVAPYFMDETSIAHDKFKVGTPILYEWKDSIVTYNVDQFSAWRSV